MPRRPALPLEVEMVTRYQNQKPDVGNVPRGDYYNILMLMKENLDMLTGRVTGELVALPYTATNTQIITAINQIIARLNASTN